MKKQRQFSYFYSKSLLLCITSIIVITIVLSLFIGTLLDRNEKITFFSSYDKALSDLHRSLQSKKKNFYTELTPLFSKPEYYNSLVKLLEDDTQNADPMIRSESAAILGELSSRNRYCVGVLLYSHDNQMLYRYDMGFQSVQGASVETILFDGADFQSQLLSQNQLARLDPTLPLSIYGLTGTISKSLSANGKTKGTIVFLYNLSELHESIDSYAFPSWADISLYNKQGYPVYSSQGDYSANLMKDSSLFMDKTNNIVTTPPHKTTQQGTEYYESSISNGRYEYLVSYRLPAQKISDSPSKNLLFILSFTICLLSVSIYGVSFYRAHKKIKSIEVGMEHIGENNLEYRIPAGQGDDEYAQIIHGFNRMCDELQDNIETKYVYELKQKQSELYAMQVSVDPHFLYNTLEMIRMQSLAGNSQDVSQMVLLLSKIYRSQVSRNMYVSLIDEIQHCENIICLYQYRFKNFEYDISLSDDILSYGLPNNTLQPIIENYFVHGFDHSREDNTLMIRGEFAQKEGGKIIQLIVEDNGKSITNERLTQIQNRLKLSVFDSEKEDGLALPNVNTRLRIVFGETSGIHIDRASASRGFRVELLFPPVLARDLEQSHRDEILRISQKTADRATKKTHDA